MDNKSSHGGARTGAGRKPGKKIGPIKPPTILYQRRVTEEEKIALDNLLDELKKLRNNNKN